MIDDKKDNTEKKIPLDKVLPVEFGGSKDPDPTRYNDWQINGKCVDF